MQFRNIDFFMQFRNIDFLMQFRNIDFYAISKYWFFMQLRNIDFLCTNLDNSHNGLRSPVHKVSVEHVGIVKGGEAILKANFN